MTDVFTAQKRSKVMAAIGQKNTKPEIAVRRLLHRMGYRFRIHRRDLPGRPDIVLPGRRKIVLVHGCFWHGHNCKVGRLPKSRLDYWIPKIEGNRLRDIRNLDDLKARGWDVLVLWECEVRSGQSLEPALAQFLGEPGQVSTAPLRYSGKPGN